jgi:hypothetical protein
MKNWELNLAHDKAIRDGQAIMNGVPLPIQDPPGGLKMLKPNQLTKFNGKLFWAHMEGLGHNSTSYQKCSCRAALR